jgi:hypothetical protein
MCRRPIYFSGFHKLREKWDEDAWETRCAEVLGEALQERIDEFLEVIEEDCEILAEQDNNETATWVAVDMLDTDEMNFLDEAEEFETKREVIALYRNYKYRELMQEVIRIERTYRFLKSECVSSETIEEILLYSDEYFSDRGIDKWVWNDEPQKEFATKYPGREGGARTGKRSRAREDPWSEMTFYIIV